MKIKKSYVDLGPFNLLIFPYTNFNKKAQKYFHQKNVGMVPQITYPCCNLKEPTLVRLIMAG